MLKQQRNPSGLVSPGLTVSLRYNQAGVCTYAVKQEYYRLLRMAVVPGLCIHVHVLMTATGCRCGFRCLFSLAQGSLTNFGGVHLATCREVEYI